MTGVSKPQVGDHMRSGGSKYWPHRNHVIEVAEVDDDSIRWRCTECNSDPESWWTVWDPAGELGSDEAPEG